MRRIWMVVAACCALVVSASACSPSAIWNGSDDKGANSSGASPKVEITNITDGATNVATAVEVAYTVNGAAGTTTAGTTTAGTTTTDATKATVSLVDDSGTAVAGAPRPDGSSWVPTRQLEYGRKYALTVTAAKPDGGSGTAKATFTTMAEPADLVDIHSWIGDDQLVGVGMPVVVTFGLDVPDGRQADIQRRLFVRSDPPQEGIWNWTNPHEVHFRPREYWQPGTRLDVRLGTGGLAWGVKNWYGRHDITINATVGAAHMISIDNATKRMTVTKDGQTVLTVPVSLGKPSAPSSSGNLLIISRNEWEWFDSSTYGVAVTDPDGYRTKVEWTMRLTWDGQYIHAAPWSVADQGRRNVSHGCVNIPTAEAHWLYDFVQVGDPVTVTGTETHVAWGQGWTDWDRSWEDYVKGSAIAYVAPPAPPTTAPQTTKPQTTNQTPTPARS